MKYYTKDYLGGFVFQKSDFKKENVANCIIAYQGPSVGVYPLKIFQKYDFGGYMAYLPGEKEQYIRELLDDDRRQSSIPPIDFEVLYKEKSFNSLCNTCKNRLKFLTGKCNLSSCHKYRPLDIRSHINTKGYKFIKRKFCDLGHRARSKLYFNQLSPDQKTIKANKKAFHSRGKKAALSRKNTKKKCSKCVGKNFCKKWEHINEDCLLTRKMVNRKVRKIINEKLGSYDNWLKMYRVKNYFNMSSWKKELDSGNTSELMENVEEKINQTNPRELEKNDIEQKAKMTFILRILLNSYYYPYYYYYDDHHSYENILKEVGFEKFRNVLKGGK